ncbi:hypothetical protein [Fulvimarina manganoxydans]|nr:hypothetical protein [Fulvimarina manganoxydans]
MATRFPQIQCGSEASSMDHWYGLIELGILVLIMAIAWYTQIYKGPLAVEKRERRRREKREAEHRSGERKG